MAKASHALKHRIFIFSTFSFLSNLPADPVFLSLGVIFMNGIAVKKAV